MSIPKKIEKHLTTAAPVQVLIKRSKQTFIPGFSGFSLFEVWPRFVQQLRNTSLLERASGISFNVVMAIPPTLLFLFTLIPYLPISTRFIQELYVLIRTVVPGKENNGAIISFLDDFLNQPRGELLSFGLLLALFFSSNAMMGILRSFDKNYEGFGDPTGLQKRSMALQLTLLSFVLFFVSVSLLIAQGAVLQWLGVKSYALRLLIVNVRWIILFLLVYFIISFIYRHGPPLKEKWPYLTPGSVFATTLTFLATFLVSFWINNFANYNKLYGSISAIMILMILIYVNAVAILVGFELNVTIASLRRLKALKQQTEQTVS